MRSKRPPTTTRDELAKAIFDRFQFDMGQLWEWLQSHGHLPRDQPDDWDPMFGEGGALAHLRGRGQGEGDGTVQHHWFLHFDDGSSLRPPCRECGIARAVAGCYFEVHGSFPHLAYVKIYAAKIEAVSRAASALQTRLRSATDRYRASHARYRKGFVAAAIQKVRRKVDLPAGARETMIAKLREGLENPELLGVRDEYAALEFDAAFGDVAQRLLILLDQALVDMRLPSDKTVWPKGAGRAKKLVSRVQATLREEGFELAEVVSLTEREDDPGLATDRASKRVRRAGAKRR